jgi:hypothetical protein
MNGKAVLVVEAHRRGSENDLSHRCLDTKYLEEYAFFFKIKTARRGDGGDRETHRTRGAAGNGGPARRGAVRFRRTLFMPLSPPLPQVPVGGTCCLPLASCWHQLPSTQPIRDNGNPTPPAPQARKPQPRRYTAKRPLLSLNPLTRPPSNGSQRGEPTP